MVAAFFIMQIEQLLKEKGIKFDSLTPEELVVFNEQVNAYRNSKLSVDDIQEAIRHLITTLERDIAEVHPLHLFKSLELRARLKNYLQLEAIFRYSEDTRNKLEQSLKTLKG